jgi:hypothetical protein
MNIIDARYRFLSDHNLVFAYNNALAQWEVEQVREYPKDYLLKSYEVAMELSMKEVSRRDLDVSVIEGGRLTFDKRCDLTYDWF